MVITARGLVVPVALGKSVGTKEIDYPKEDVLDVLCVLLYFLKNEQFSFAFIFCS